jgi:hypothetical protein
VTRRTGSKYEEIPGFTYAEIAKLIRGDIKDAVNEGTLPRLAKYSVRISTYAGGGSINIRMHSLPRGVTAQNDAACTMGCVRWHRYECPANEHLSDRAVAAVAVLKEIWESYNFYESHGMQDGCSVNFFGDVDYFKGGTTSHEIDTSIARVGDVANG